MNELRESINLVIDKIGMVTDLCYAQKKAEASAAMMGFTELLTALYTQLSAGKQRNESFSFNEKEFLLVLSDAVAAMEAGDMVLLADKLEYDLRELLEAAAESADV